MSQRSNEHELLTRYLLGSASAAEREAVEDRFFVVQSRVDELLQVEDELIDDYVRGRLTESERALFEENFLRTAGRQQRLEFTRDLVEALAHWEAGEGPEELFNVPRRGGGVRIAPGGAPEPDTAERSERLGGQRAPDYRPETFDGLLRWLDPIRDRAGEKYETIRRRLIQIFALRGYVDAEALADETLDRVARKVTERPDTYSVDPTHYIYGVARHVLLEHQRRQSARMPMLPEGAIQEPGIDTANELEQTHSCLEKCLERLRPGDRELILQYYSLGEAGKESNRREISQSLGISLNALRLRVRRLRVVIQECVKSCLEQSKG